MNEKMNIINFLSWIIICIGTKLIEMTIVIFANYLSLYKEKFGETYSY